MKQIYFAENPNGYSEQKPIAFKKKIEFTQVGQSKFTIMLNVNDDDENYMTLKDNADQIVNNLLFNRIDQLKDLLNDIRRINSCKNIRLSCPRAQKLKIMHWNCNSLGVKKFVLKNILEKKKSRRN